MSRIISRFFQLLGLLISFDNYESPIPRPQVLKNKAKFWQDESKLIGINMNLENQLYFLDKVFPNYKKEYRFSVEKTDIPYEFYLNNETFGLQPAAILHSMIRCFRPKTIIEVGSGKSTCVSARSCLMNERDGCSSKLVSIEPYPNAILKKGFPGLSKLIIKNIEEVPIDFFGQLDENDILFIDSSHISKIYGDVNYLYLEVLPRLKKGVLIHIHDIFIPYDYPEDWVFRLKKFYNEQYLLHAFLCFNDAYEITFANYYMNLKYPEKMAEVFKHPNNFKGLHKPSSFWLKKII